MRKCHKCKMRLRNDKFPSRTSVRCKKCLTALRTKKHKRRQKREVPVRYNDRVRKLHSPSRKACTALVAKLKANPCVDCGGVFDSVSMDFDHLPGFEKVESVSRLAAQGRMEDLVLELEKCDLVCANCHRVRTKKRGQ